MVIDFESKVLKVPEKLAIICNANTAMVYAVLLASSNDNGIAQISKNEIAYRAGIASKSVQRIIRKLEDMSIIECQYNVGYATTYHVKNILPAEQPESEQVRAAAPAEVPAEPEEPARQSERQPAKQPKSKKIYKMSYSVMLYKIRSPLYTEGFESEGELGNLDREIESCMLPQDFCFAEGLENTVADALKYLAYYSRMPDDERKEFAEATITCLSEAICTGMKNKKNSCNPEEIIKRINNLNKKDGLNQWIYSFSRKYSDMLDYNAANIKRNRHNYLKTCAVNYLTEYDACIMPGFMDFYYDDEEE